jgi:hypothetical protein
VNIVAKELKRIDISRIPELLSIAHEVQRTNEPRILRQDSEDVAMLTPIKPAAKRGSKGKPTSAADPLWDIVGIGQAEEAQDVAANKDKYLADAYAAKAK